jgi:hypothetical protein
MYLRWDGNRPLADREMLATLYEVSVRTVRRYCTPAAYEPRRRPAGAGPAPVRPGTALYDALAAAQDLEHVAPRPGRTVAALSYRFNRGSTPRPSTGRWEPS